MIKKLGVVGLIIAALSLIGCDFQTKKASEKKVYISLNVESSTQGRTAVPEAINWNDYTFTLAAIESFGTADAKAETTLYTGKRYTELNTPVEVNAVNYKFTLTAYSAATPVFSGVNEADLSSGSKSLTFRMYPVSGMTGTAVITLNLPDDDVIEAILSLLNGASKAPV